MTKNNDELNLDLLEDLIFKLEIKEAVENGDLGEINFCLKHILRFISTFAQSQKGKIEKETEIINSTNKLIQLNSNLSKSLSDQTTKHGEEILKLAKRIKALEQSE